MSDEATARPWGRPSNRTLAPRELRTSGPRSLRELLPAIALWTGGALLVAVVVVLTVVVSSDENAVATLRREVHAQAAALGGRAGGQSVQSEARRLSSETSGLGTSLNMLSNDVRQLQGKLGAVCDPTKVSDEQSNLTGEANVEGSSQYFADLQNIILAICQPGS